MYCPRCKTEYREGFNECADCKIPLMKKLSEKKEIIPEEFVELISSFNQADIAMIKSILDRYKLKYFVYDELFNLIRPCAQPARFMVNKNDLKQAKSILQEMDVKYVAVSVDNPSDKKNILESEKDEAKKNFPSDEEAGKIIYCIECKRPFLITERYEDTNLCVDCFEKDVK